MVATSNTGLKGALGLSTQNAACLAAQWKAWDPPFGVTSTGTARNRPLDQSNYGLNFPNLAFWQVADEEGMIDAMLSRC